jgi:hypothetical protein
LLQETQITTENDSSFEPNPLLALSDVSLTYNKSIDDVELTLNGDEIHSPSIAQKRGRLLHRRKVSNVEKLTVKKSQNNQPCNTNPNQREQKKGYLLSFP